MEFKFNLIKIFNIMVMKGPSNLTIYYTNYICCYKFYIDPISKILNLVSNHHKFMLTRYLNHLLLNMSMFIYA